MKGVSVATRRICIAFSALALLLIAVGSVYLFRQYRLRQIIAHWREEGIGAQKSGNYALAIRDLAGYLDRRPNDQEALAAFADAHPHLPSPDHQDVTQTINALSSLVRLNPGALNRRMQLLELFAHAGAQTETIESASAILQVDPSNATAYDAKSQAQVNLKEYKEALATCRAWQIALPMSLPAEIRVIALEGQLSIPLDQILAEIDAGSKQHPGQPARTEFCQALAYAVTADKDHCRTLLLAAAARTPKDDDLDEALVAQLGVYGRAGEDISALTRFVQAGAGAKCRQTLVRRLWEMGKVPQALDAAMGLDLNDSSVTSDVLAMLALSAQGVGRTSAGAGVNGALSKRHDPVSLAWIQIIASQSSSDWATERTVADGARQALMSAPADGYIAFYLGNALADLGENELALEAWRRAAGICPTWGLPLSRMSGPLADQGDFGGAAQAAVDGLRRTPTLGAALSAAHMFLALDENGFDSIRDQATKLMDQLSKIAPGSEDLVELRVRFLCRDGQIAEAQELIQNVLAQKSPPSESLLLNLAATSRKYSLQLEGRLFEADQNLHDLTPAVAVNRAVDESIKTGKDSGLALFDSLQRQAGAKSNIEWDISRAACLSALGFSTAQTAWIDLGSQHPDDLAIQLRVIQSGTLNSNRPAVLTVIGRMRKILGNDSLRCDLEQARILVATRSGDDDDRSITELLRRIIAMHPTMVEPRTLWAQALEDEGHTDEAINQLQLAAKIDPLSVSIALRLAALEQTKGDYDSARLQLEQVTNQNAANAGQINLAARLRQSMGDIPGAIALLRKGSRRTEEQDVYLAELYCQANQVGPADEIVTQLMKTPSPEVLNFAARFYAATGKESLARSALDQLRAAKTPEADMILAEAEVDLAFGKPDQAAALLAAGVQKFPGDARLWRARVTTQFSSARPADALAIIGQGLAALKTDAVLSALKDANSGLCVALTVPDIAPIARQFVEAPINQPAELDVIGVVAQATLSTDINDAVKQAQALSQRYPRLEGVQLWTVRVYMKARRFREASAAMTRLLQSFPASADAAAMAAAFFSSQNSWNQALSAAQQWRAQTEPGGVPDISIARALLGLGRPGEAVTQLQPFVVRTVATADPNARLLLVYARALCATGAASQAADLLLPLAHDKPNWRQSCLSFASQFLNAADAQKWLERIAPDIDPKSDDQTATMAEAWEILSARSGADQVQCMKKAQSLFDGIAAKPDATAAALGRAALFHERLQQFDAAVALYHRSLALDASQLVYKNNLAMLLARTPSGLPEALTLARSLVTAFPGEPEFQDTLSFVHSKAGAIDDAVSDLQHAVDLAPEDLRFQIELARLLADNRRKPQAGRVLAAIDTSGMDLSSLPAGQQHDLEQLRGDLAPTTREITQ